MWGSENISCHVEVVKMLKKYDFHILLQPRANSESTLWRESWCMGFGMHFVSNVQPEPSILQHQHAASSHQGKIAIYFCRHLLVLIVQFVIQKLYIDRWQMISLRFQDFWLHNKLQPYSFLFQIVEADYEPLPEGEYSEKVTSTIRK